MQVSAEVTVAVAANTGGAAIMAADVELAFDEARLRVTACGPGAAVKDTAGFECRYNMPGLLGSAQVSYVSVGGDEGQTHQDDAAADARGAAELDDGQVELAWVTFKVRRLLPVSELVSWNESFCRISVTRRC